MFQVHFAACIKKQVELPIPKAPFKQSDQGRTLNKKHITGWMFPIQIARRIDNTMEQHCQPFFSSASGLSLIPQGGGKIHHNS